MIWRVGIHVQTVDFQNRRRSEIGRKKVKTICFCCFNVSESLIQLEILASSKLRTKHITAILSAVCESIYCHRETKPRFLHLWVYVHVCVCERKAEKEREYASSLVHACVVVSNSVSS